MRRFFTLLCLLGLALPVGISISGCVRNPAGNYCNGLGYGPKDTDITSIILQPQIAGISLAYGQTTQVQSPSAYTCKQTPASLGTNQLNYGTSNNQLADISPGGNLCAGTWNRNTGGGIADYTYCYAPNPLPSSKGLPYAVGYVYVTADSVTSNPVAVYIHAPVTAISLATTSLSSSSPQQCFSQNQVAELDTQACYAVTNSSGVTTQYEFCAPPTVTAAILFARVAWRRASLRFPVADLHRYSQFLGQQLQRRQYCSRNQYQSAVDHHRAPARHHLHHRHHCAIGIVGWLLLHLPAGIRQSLAGHRIHQWRVTQGVSQNLTATVLDTLGNPISGLNLQYESTNPVDIGATGAGTITAAFPVLVRSMRSASRSPAILPPSMSSALMAPACRFLPIPSASPSPAPPANTSGTPRPVNRSTSLPWSCSPETPAPSRVCPSCPIPWSWTRTATTSTSVRPAS